MQISPSVLLGPFLVGLYICIRLLCTSTVILLSEWYPSGLCLCSGNNTILDAKQHVEVKDIRLKSQGFLNALLIVLFDSVYKQCLCFESLLEFLEKQQLLGTLFVKQYIYPYIHTRSILFCTVTWYITGLVQPHFCVNGTYVKACM